ncbi:hypothetical protein [Natrinema salinisoli]|uniref:hypothetical protein n=1 Tax=Natrinema salinisoli TaxID=2878535 RepID=UPI001CEFC59D|nr:hypothetical protein [Natrinema salinisoli]
MSLSRRQLLSASTTGAISLSLAGTVQAAAGSASSDDARSDLPTSDSPVDSVITETQQEFDLSEDDPYKAYTFPRFDETAVIEYEIRPEESGAEPDVLVLDHYGFSEYEVQVGSYPVLGSKMVNLGRFGTHQFPTIHMDNIGKWWQQRQKWDVESIVNIKALDCLTEERATQAAHRIGEGTYNIVFDWSSKVLAEPADDSTTVDVLIRARYREEETAVDEATDEIASFYTLLPGSESLAQTMVQIADEICSQVPAEMDGLTADDIDDDVSGAERTASVLQSVLEVIENKTGYSAPLAEALLEETARWTRWTGQVLPVVSTVEELLDDSCAVSQSDPDTVTGDVENMLMSMGILVAEIVMIKYGLVSRAASFAVRKLDTYLLGVVREVLGLKTYLVLLRELYMTLEYGIEEILGMIEDITRDVVKTQRFLSDRDVDDVSVVEDMDDEDDLKELSFERNWHLGPFDPSPECHPDSLF